MFLSIKNNSTLDLIMKAAADLILSEMNEISKSPVTFVYSDLQRCLITAAEKFAKDDVYLLTMIRSNPELLFSEFRCNYLLEGGACYVAEIGVGELLIIPAKKFETLDLGEVFDGAASIYDGYSTEEEDEEIEEAEPEDEEIEEAEPEDEEFEEDEDDEEFEEDEEDEDDEDEDLDEDEEEDDEDFSDLGELDGIDELFSDDEEDEPTPVQKKKTSKPKVTRRSTQKPTQAKASKTKAQKPTKKNRINRR